MASRTASALTALALAALSVAAVLTLGRVFASGRFALPVIGAVLVVHLLGFLARARRWPIVDALSLWSSGLAVYLIWVLALSTTVYGLPTLETFRVLGERLGDGLHELRTSVVPAPATDGAVVLCVVVAWVMAATADALAFWRRATIGAVAPALALFVWASTLGTDTLATGTTAAFVVAALLFLLVQQQTLLERGRARFVGRRVLGPTGIWTFAALAGAIAVLGGLVVGPALPGADADPLIDVRGSGPSDRTYRTEPPLARIGADYAGRGRVEVFSVRSPREEYWRIAALDAYDSANGGQWTLNAQGAGQVKEGLHAPVDDTMLRQEFQLTGLADRWLPAAFRPVQVEGGDDPLVVEASTTLVSTHKDVKDLTYTVSSRLGASSDSVTDAQRQGTNAPLSPEMQQYTALPDDFPGDVRAKALAITDGKTTPFDRARALEQFFLDPAEDFQYSLNVDLGPGAQTQSAIQEFLQTRTGFCVQFAGSFAAMARAAGLPARVAVGYTPGLYDSTARVYRVTSEDAHAWAEVWLAGLGWTRFEPTPASDLPGGSRLPGRQNATTPSGPAATAPATSAPASPTTAGPSGVPGNPAEVTIDPPAATDDDRDGFSFSWIVVFALLIGAVTGTAAVFSGIVVAKRRRRHGRRTRPDPAGAITGAWEEVLDRLGEAGVEPAPARTPLELASQASVQLPDDAASPLRQLAETYTATRYASAPPDSHLVRAAWRDAGAVSSALRAGAGLRERWRRRLDPTPLRR